MKCDNCNNPATVHSTEIKNGQKIEKHLCQNCATQSDPMNVKGHTPINELLTNFVLAHSGIPKESGAKCEHCGITWQEFRSSGLFGCEHDYALFENDLTPILQRAHEGGTHHHGKVPNRRGASASRRKVDVSRLRKELARAVEAEDYERCARLRDQIRQAEHS